jgi:HEPN domain-containing protein
VNRAELQQLAEDRILDARALLDAQRWSGAYYLAGYAVECALKACIAKLTNQFDFPDKSFAQKCFTHDIEKLVEHAGLAESKDDDANANEKLAANWLKAQAWKEDARYIIKTDVEATELYQAIADKTDGVMQWLKKHW